MGTMTKALLFCVCMGVAICQENGEIDPTVVIRGTTFTGKHGDVDFQGTTKTYRMFKGIPYAQPPVGDLRFRKPETLIGQLPSPFIAKEYGYGCLQPDFEDYMIFIPKNQSEDCLYLNVFVPDETPDKSAGHAVMVYVHGGGYVMGSGELGAEYLASYGNVILVSFNYRLGVFGFVGTGDESGPGNLGLWDQQLALQWVHNNIGSFGGDNQRVTIFGESAGAASVHFQSLYPPNKGLFQRVIAQSGSPGQKLLFIYDPKGPLKSYAELVGCDADTPKGQIDCLRETSADKISEVIQKINTEQSILDTRVFPYFDNDFITFDPAKSSELSEDNEALQFYRSLDMINGFNSQEGISVYDPTYVPMVQDRDTYIPTREEMDNEGVPYVVMVFYEPLDDKLLKLVSSLYTDWSDPDNGEVLRDQLVKLIGDMMMAVPSVQYSRVHVNTTATTNSYTYLFSPLPSNPIIYSPSWAKGANHGEDLGFVFFFHCLDERLPSNGWEYDLSYDVMKYWTNFAKSGNPNEPVPVKVEWSKYDLAEQSYLVLDKDMKDEYRKKYFYAREADIWLNTIPCMKSALDKEASRRSCSAQGSCSSDGECPGKTNPATIAVTGNSPLEPAQLPSLVPLLTVEVR